MQLIFEVLAVRTLFTADSFKEAENFARGLGQVIQATKVYRPGIGGSRGTDGLGATIEIKGTKRSIEVSARRQGDYKVRECKGVGQGKYNLACAQDARRSIESAVPDLKVVEDGTEALRAWEGKDDGPADALIVYEALAHLDGEEFSVRIYVRTF